MAQPFRNQFQPWIVGRYYPPNLVGGDFSTNVFSGATTPLCFVAPMLLDKIYNFDQAGIFVTVTNANYTGRIGIYKLDPNTHLPVTLVDTLGTVSLGTAAPSITLSPVKSYSGLIGLALQVEGSGGTNPQVRIEMGGDYPTIGYGYAAPWSGSTSGAAQYAFSISAAQGATNGALPTVDKFSYARLQANGCGVVLRRAA